MTRPDSQRLGPLAARRQRRRLAELAVALGANVQQDQIVTVGATLGDEEMAREVAAAAVSARARASSTSTYFDPYVKRARIEHAREETLDFVP